MGGGKCIVRKLFKFFINTSGSISWHHRFELVVLFIYFSKRKKPGLSFGTDRETAPHGRHRRSDREAATTCSYFKNAQPSRKVFCCIYFCSSQFKQVKAVGYKARNVCMYQVYSHIIPKWYHRCIGYYQPVHLLIKLVPE